MYIYFLLVPKINYFVPIVIAANIFIKMHFGAKEERIPVSRQKSQDVEKKNLHQRNRLSRYVKILTWPRGLRGIIDLK